MAQYFLSTTSATTVTTAMELITTAGGALGESTKVGKSTGWGVLWSHGNGSAWAAGASEPAFGDVHGWLLDDTSLEGMKIQAGSWSVSMAGHVSGGTITATPVVRMGVRSSAGVFTEIAKATLASTSFGTTNVTVTGSATQAADQSFSVGDKLYVQLELDITANSTGSTTATVSAALLNTSGASVTSPTIVAGGSTFNDSGSGTITLSGSTSEGLVFGDGPSGTITLSASSSSSTVFGDSGSGTIVLSGSSSDNYVPPGTSFTDSGSGSITLSGSRLESLGFVDSPTGTFSLTGSRTESSLHSSSPVGTFSLTGSSTGSWSNSTTASGTVLFSGSGFDLYVPPGGINTAPDLHLSVAINRLRIH